jgi:hypothetical protein
MIEIESGIPIPHKEPRTNDSKWPFGFMRIGDSILVTDPKEAERARIAAAVRANRTSMKFVTKKEAAGLRIWRTE